MSLINVLFSRFFLLLIVGLLAGQEVVAQSHRLQQNASQLLHELLRIENRSSILYVAAHPDDENTRLIAYLANELKANVNYLSITRGDGGQNLVGPELREDLGLIRSYELLEARKRDGGNQRFTRANDFGYSKHHAETFQIWDKEKVLSDVVRAIRITKPQIIVTRFDTTGGHTHGHHTASAKLALEAFELASKESAFPEQLSEGLETWQAQSIFWNAYSWRGVPDEIKNNPNTLTFNMGRLNPLLGSTYDEIAAVSRSQHKSQGFGSSPRYGELTEYLVPWKKSISKNRFITLSSMSWANDDNLIPFIEELTKLKENFKIQAPHLSVSSALSLAQKLEPINSEVSKELQDWAFKCSGLRLRFNAPKDLVVENELVRTIIQANSSTAEAWLLDGVEINGIKAFEIVPTTIGQDLFEMEEEIKIRTKAANDSPYWLNKIEGIGMYQVDNDERIGLPMNSSPINATFKLQYQNLPLEVLIPLEYTFTDPTKGEVVKEVGILPELEVFLSDDLMIQTDDHQFIFQVHLKNNSSKPRTLQLEAIADSPEWKIEFDSPTIVFNNGQEKKIVQASARITTDTGQSRIEIRAVDTKSERTFHNYSSTIEYDHIPRIRRLKNSELMLVKLDVQTQAQRVLYIQGAGDAVDVGLEEIGIQVDRIHATDISAQDLSKYDAIVTGIRAYNVASEAMRKASEQINTYIQNGGTFLIQYNTLSRNLPEKLGPLAFEISRDRVTNEQSKVIFSDPAHPILNMPNKLSQRDFEGWVQERGLYFARKMDSTFQSPLQFVEEGEEISNGALIIGEYGKGHVIYTGISFFRELPAGVSGAYRLLANLVSYGK